MRIDEETLLMAAPVWGMLFLALVALFLGFVPAKCKRFGLIKVSLFSLGMAFLCTCAYLLALPLLIPEERSRFGAMGGVFLGSIVVSILLLIHNAAELLVRKTDNGGTSDTPGPPRMQKGNTTNE